MVAKDDPILEAAEPATMVDAEEEEEEEEEVGGPSL